MCAIFAFGAKAEILPVTRSSKRAPTQKSRSHAFTALFAAISPCMPSMHSDSSSVSGNAPSPSSVVVTGMSALCASSRTRSAVSEPMTPPPT